MGLFSSNKVKTLTQLARVLAALGAGGGVMTAAEGLWGREK